MAEAIAVAALALAGPPCIRAVMDISPGANVWATFAGTLRLSSQAQISIVSYRVLRAINKVRAELEKGRKVLPPDRIRECVDKLNRTIELYNDLVTEHSAADSKTRLGALETAEKASTRLLEDIKSVSRKYGNEKLVKAVKTCLYYDQNIIYPDGTIAAYDRDNVHPHTLPLHAIDASSHEFRSFMSSTLVPSTTSPSTSAGTCQDSSKINLFFLPFPATSACSHSPHNHQFAPSKEFHLLGTIPTLEGHPPLIDFGSTSHFESQNPRLPEEDSIHGQPAEFSFIDFS
ncbi:hypothetical protein DL96DRAFT_1718068 [Flagelloscypha sp. PMI_526]|nr:hypothetical protein DL96DRAFT_1718068 [Flagelloscypha sp. PMI_526]